MGGDRPGLGHAADHGVERLRLCPQVRHPSEGGVVTQRPAGAGGGARPPATAGDRIRAALVSCFGLGYAPVASGTFGTLGGVALVWLLAQVAVPRFGWHFGVAAVVCAALVLLLGIALGGWAERYYGFKDPKPFVLDEVLGYLIAVFRWGEGVPGTKELVLAFFAFRLFDVVKPPPARRLEFLPKGVGIMLDDLVAGLYALALVWVVRDYLEWP
ncbi:MAG: phosphatidylglycerophosphatase A [Planctomycetes bacterium]|nr:phosphatidylglycerophosphatase A [Planctomycetota bacterium]